MLLLTLLRQSRGIAQHFVRPQFHRFLLKVPNSQNQVSNVLVRNLRTTQPRLVNPIILAFIKPFSRVFAMVVGKRVRKWWRALPDESKQSFRNSLKRKKGLWVGLGGSLLAFTVYGYESHIQECPFTKRRRFVALNQDQVEKIASVEFDDLMVKFEGELVPDSHPSYRRISRVASRILKANSDISQIHDKDWTITVINRDDKNAFVLPNGNIFVFTGMLDMCTNDDMLGIILSHEIAHTVLGHSGEMLSYVSFLNAMLMIPLAVIWAFLPNDGIALVADWFFHRVYTMAFELPYNRDMEAEADKVGLRLAAKACFDVREAPAFWAKMELADRHESPEAERMPIELLSTHPSHKNRESNLAAMLPEALSVRSSCGCAKLGLPDPYDEFKKYLERLKRAQKVPVIVIG